LEARFTTPARHHGGGITTRSDSFGRVALPLLLLTLRNLGCVRGSCCRSAAQVSPCAAALQSQRAWSWNHVCWKVRPGPIVLLVHAPALAQLPAKVPIVASV
jgi:hypothetical protein